MFFTEMSQHVLVQHVVTFSPGFGKGLHLFFFVTVFLFFFPVCVEWPLKVIELNFITPCQPPLGRKQLRTKIRLQKTGWEKLEEHHTCLPYPQEEHVCDKVKGM